MLDSGAEGFGFKSQPQRCRVTVLGKLQAWRKVMAAYRRVYDSRHLPADCQERGSAQGTYARSAVEYWLPFTVHRVSSHSASVLGGDDRRLKSWHGTQSEPIGRHAARLPAASAPVMVMTVEVPLAQSSW